MNDLSNRCAELENMLASLLEYARSTVPEEESWPNVICEAQAVLDAGEAYGNLPPLQQR